MLKYKVPDPLPPKPPEDMPLLLRRRYYTDKGSLRIKGVPLRKDNRKCYRKAPAKKRRKPKWTHKQLVWIAEYLNHRIGLKPPIEVAVGVRKLKQDLEEILPLISQKDRLNDRAWAVLRKLGWNELMSVTMEEHFAHLLKQGCSRISTLRRKMRERFKTRIRAVTYRMQLYIDLLHHLQFIRVSTDGEMLKLCVRPYYS